MRCAVERFLLLLEKQFTTLTLKSWVLNRFSIPDHKCERSTNWLFLFFFSDWWSIERQPMKLAQPKIWAPCDQSHQRPDFQMFWKDNPEQLFFGVGSCSEWFFLLLSFLLPYQLRKQSERQAESDLTCTPQEDIWQNNRHNIGITICWRGAHCFVPVQMIKRNLTREQSWWRRRIEKDASVDQTVVLSDCVQIATLWLITRHLLPRCSTVECWQRLRDENGIKLLQEKKDTQKKKKGHSL